MTSCPQHCSAILICPRLGPLPAQPLCLWAAKPIWLSPGCNTEPYWGQKHEARAYCVGRPAWLPAMLPLWPQHGEQLCVTAAYVPEAAYALGLPMRRRLHMHGGCTCAGDGLCEGAACAWEAAYAWGCTCAGDGLCEGAAYAQETAYVRGLPMRRRRPM